MALLAGLTGGMGSGKTTVAQMLSDLGAHVIDADTITRSLVEPGKPAFQEIVDFMGSGVLRDEGTLDREKIADRVFNDTGKKVALEAILHPGSLRKSSGDIIKSGKAILPHWLSWMRPCLLNRGITAKSIRSLWLPVTRKPRFKESWSKTGLPGPMPKEDCVNRCLWRKKSNSRIIYFITIPVILS